jgi:hypothetical protein
MTRRYVWEHVELARGFIQVQAARMRNTLLPVEDVYWYFSGVWGLQMSCDGAQVLLMVVGVWWDEMRWFCRVPPWPYIHDQRVILYKLWSLSILPISFIVAYSPAYLEFNHLLSQVSVKCIAFRVCVTSSPDISAHNSDAQSLSSWIKLAQSSCNLLARPARQTIERPIRWPMTCFCAREDPGDIYPP